MGTRRIKSPAVGDVDACDRVGLVRPPTAMTSRHREASQRSVVPLCHASHQVPHSHGPDTNYAALHRVVLPRVAPHYSKGPSPPSGTGPVGTGRVGTGPVGTGRGWSDPSRGQLTSPRREEDARHKPRPASPRVASRRGRHKPRRASPRVGSRRGGWRHGRHGRHGQGAEASREQQVAARGSSRSQLNNAG